MPPQLEYFVRLFHYDDWANRETLGSLSRSGGPPHALRWMAHLAGSGLLWLSRLRDEPPAMAVWPDLDLEGCSTHLERAGREWQAYLSGLAEADLIDGIGYRNSKGEFWTSSVADILTHVSHHGAYHRGQIAAAIRAGGHQPAYTDFIHAARQGVIG